MRASRSARAAALAEHPLEHFPRVDLHRHRRRRRAPRQRVHVDAAVVAIARADQAGVILGGELHRREHRVLTDLLCGNLVGGHAGERVNTLSRLRPHTTEPRRGAERVDGGRICCAMAKSAHDVQAIAERLERLEDRRELESGALGRRRPLVHDGAVRDVDESEARERLGRGLCQQRPGRNHRVEQRQRQTHPDALQERSARQVLLGDEHFVLSPGPAKAGHYDSLSRTLRFSSFNSC